MRCSRRKKAKSSKSSRWCERPTLVLLALLGVALHGCAGSSAVRTDDTAPGSRPADTVAASLAPAAGVQATDDGRYVLVAPDTALLDATWVGIFPVLWPEDGSERPLLGTGYVTPNGDEMDLRILGMREVGALSDLRVEPAASLQALDGSKIVVRVTDTGDRTITLDCGDNAGVSVGDRFFILRESAEYPARFGEQIDAIVRVTAVGSKTSEARVEHAGGPLSVDQIAVFAQARLDIPTETATILVAPMRTGETQDAALPAIVEAIPATLAEFGLSNIGVAGIEQFLDPAAPQATREASEAMEGRDGYGVLVFGSQSDDELIVNLSTWGTAPHPGSTVGMLPGGLPIPVERDVAALSIQLVPSFISNVLALRGDHASAVYLLETVLRRESLHPDVRYHLREHLALRYDAIGRSDEALWLMTEDIGASRASGSDLALLNALSIRASLANENQLLELWVADTAEFLQVATGTLPDESLGGERLAHARALSASGEVDEARSTILAVASAAEATGDADLQVWAMIDLAVTTAADDEAEAALILDALVEQDLGAERTTLLLVDLLAAELAVERGDTQTALERVGRSLQALDDGDSLPLKAAVYRRAATVFGQLERWAESTTALEAATGLYLESAQLEQATSMLIQLAMTQLRLAGVVAPREAIQLFQQARTNLYLGAELAVHLGYDASASRGFMYAGILESQFNQPETAGLMFERAERLARSCSHYALLYELDLELSSIYDERGDASNAAARRSSAIFWAEAAGIEHGLEPVSPPAF